MTETAQSPLQRLAINEEMTIYQAAQQKQLLLDALASARQIELDLSRVPGIDTAGLQLLILLKREAAARDATVRIVAHSEAVRDAMEFCNMVTYFGDPMVIPAA